MCEVAHTSLGIGKLWGRRSTCGWEVAMPITNLWIQNVPRVELDQRSREARLRFERVDRLLVLRASITHSRLRRLFCRFTVGKYGGLPQETGIE